MDSLQHLQLKLFEQLYVIVLSLKSPIAYEYFLEFTDWHEDFFPNEELVKIMDLHNNCIGRELFLKTPKNTHKQWISLMKEQLHYAVQIVSAEEVANFPRQLVYLES